MVMKFSQQPISFENKFSSVLLVLTKGATMHQNTQFSESHVRSHLNSICNEIIIKQYVVISKRTTFVILMKWLDYDRF